MNQVKSSAGEFRLEVEYLDGLGVIIEAMKIAGEIRVRIEEEKKSEKISEMASNSFGSNSDNMSQKGE
jgi:hypothetical protein